MDEERFAIAGTGGIGIYPHGSNVGRDRRGNHPQF